MPVRCLPATPALGGASDRQPAEQYPEATASRTAREPWTCGTARRSRRNPAQG